MRLPLIRLIRHEAYIWTFFPLSTLKPTDLAVHGLLFRFTSGGIRHLLQAREGCPAPPRAAVTNSQTAPLAAYIAGATWGAFIRDAAIFRDLGPVESAPPGSPPPDEGSPARASTTRGWVLHSTRGNQDPGLLVGNTTRREARPSCMY